MKRVFFLLVILTTDNRCVTLHRLASHHIVVGFADHSDCLTEVEGGGHNGDELDCFGIYPHVLPLAVDRRSDEDDDYARKMPSRTQAELIYWGWSLHLYVLCTFSIYLFIYLSRLVR